MTVTTASMVLFLLLTRLDMELLCFIIYMLQGLCDELNIRSCEAEPRISEIPVRRKRTLSDWAV